MRKAPALIALLLAAGCTGTANDAHVNEAALAVTIQLAAESTVTCVRLFAQGTGDEQVTDGIARGDKTELHVAIYRGGTLASDVTLIARGFRGSSCDDPLVLVEQTTPVKVSFRDGEIVPVTLTLKPAVGDEDGDGYVATSAGGDDCDDQDIAVHPGAEERCDNLKDDDCNGQADCADAVCATKACSDDDACTTGEVCLGGVCANGAPVSCDATPGPCFIAPGVCGATGCSFAVNVGAACPGGVCRSDGTCVAGTVEVLCGDGIDNDNDGAKDCADSDCNQQSCTDGDPCTTGELCANGVCPTGAPSCTVAPGKCFAAPGACLTDGGCDFTQRAPGASCGSGLSCAVDAGCLPEETGGALCSNGLDDDGDGTKDCADPSCAQSSCSDNNACTAGDLCQSGSCVPGATVTCNNPPGPCFGSTSCSADGGCVYPVLTGQACPGGFCRADGGCVPLFDFKPSNFDSALLSPPDASVIFNCGTTQFDSSNLASPWTNWCGGNRPTVAARTQTAGEEVAIVTFDSLNLQPGNTLRLVGNRPVIFAVLGDATLAGDVHVGANGTTPGAGGSTILTPKAHCGAATGGPGTCSSGSSTCGGGGGGAFGTAGAIGGGSAQGANGGGAGTPNGNAAIVPLRGGCSGGRGGTTSSSDLGGAGGGAFQLSAAGKLSVQGRIYSPGGGGAAGNQSGGQNGGAGGGGSGGAILLEGRIIELKNATLTANGGAGGSGDGNNGNGSGAGNPGADGLIGSLAGAPGGQSNNAGGSGGDGGTATLLPTRGADGTGGNGSGGGGGAGVGRIRLNAVLGCSVSGTLFVSPQVSSYRAGGTPNGCP